MSNTEKTVDAPPSNKPMVSKAFKLPTDGIVQFHVSVKVNMAEFAGWEPSKIQAFFSGIAKVLAANGEEQL